MTENNKGPPPRFKASLSKNNRGLKQTNALRPLPNTTRSSTSNFSTPKPMNLPSLKKECAIMTQKKSNTILNTSKILDSKEPPLNWASIVAEESQTNDTIYIKGNNKIKENQEKSTENDKIVEVNTIYKNMQKHLTEESNKNLTIKKIEANVNLEQTSKNLVNLAHLQYSSFNKNNKTDKNHKKLYSRNDRENNISLTYLKTNNYSSTFSDKSSEKSSWKGRQKYQFNKRENISNTNDYNQIIDSLKKSLCIFENAIQEFKETKESLKDSDILKYLVNSYPDIIESAKENWNDEKVLSEIEKKYESQNLDVKNNFNDFSRFSKYNSNTGISIISPSLSFSSNILNNKYNTNNFKFNIKSELNENDDTVKTQNSLEIEQSLSKINLSNDENNKIDNAPKLTSRYSPLAKNNNYSNIMYTQQSSSGNRGIFSQFSSFELQNQFSINSNNFDYSRPQFNQNLISYQLPHGPVSASNMFMHNSPLNSPLMNGRNQFLNVTQHHFNAREQHIPMFRTCISPMLNTYPNFSYNQEMNMVSPNIQYQPVNVNNNHSHSFINKNSTENATIKDNIQQPLSCRPAFFNQNGISGWK